MDSTPFKLRSKLSKPFYMFNSEHRFRRQQQQQEAPKTPPVLTMNEEDVPHSDDAMVSHPWPTPASQSHPTPTSAPDGVPYHHLPVDASSQASIDPNAISVHHPGSVGTPSRPVSAQPGMQTPGSVEDGFYGKKPLDDQYPFHAMSSDMQIGQAFTSDDAIPIFDLENREPMPVGYRGYQFNLEEGAHSRRISGSSYSMSTSGALSDIPYEDYSTAMSDAQSFCSDYPLPSNRNSWMSSTHLSPVASPRMSAHGRTADLVRTQSRGRASPSPRPSARSAPYSLEGLRNNKRWSTGTMANRRQQQQPPQPMYHAPPETHLAHQHMATSQPSYLTACQPSIQQRNSMLLPSQLPSNFSPQGLPNDPRTLEAPPPLMSHGLFRMLQSNVDAHSLHRRYAELSDPPDLFGALSEEQSSPPEEDMNPEDPDMVPREQDLRFEGDLYTPRWVRGHGNKREGWCGICKPGRWLVLKNSAYWYDKSFSHGISAATGSPFQEPLDTRRMDGNPDVWEGLCSSCNDWIALVSNKKKGTTWFRHAYKCHSHPKAKETAKRRREGNQNKSLAASANKMGRIEPSPTQPTTNPMMHGPMPVGTMPPGVPQLQPPLLFSDAPYHNAI